MNVPYLLLCLKIESVLSLKEGELHFFSCFAAAVAKTILFFFLGSRKKKKKESLPRAQHDFVEEGHVCTDWLGGKETTKKNRLRLEDVIVLHHTIYICTVEIL